MTTATLEWKTKQVVNLFSVIDTLSLVDLRRLSDYVAAKQKAAELREADDWQWLKVLSRDCDKVAIDEMWATIDEDIPDQERPELDEFFK
ncbi:hypothetical protein AGMMS50276_20310 [Synergistales bacterium]|nr:hypothetical protein AGMMS50276_20310 [Synergistales bacterium]